MGTLGSILVGIAGLVSIVCFIMVVVKMFQNGKSGLGIATILLLCCGIGGLVAFIYGWMKSTEWNIRNLMLAWTVAIIIGIVGNLMAPGLFAKFQEQYQQQMPK
jgi:hypothetical protein